MALGEEPFNSLIEDNGERKWNSLQRFTFTCSICTFETHKGTVDDQDLENIVNQQQSHNKNQKKKKKGLRSRKDGLAL